MHVLSSLTAIPVQNMVKPRMSAIICNAFFNFVLFVIPFIFFFTANLFNIIVFVIFLLKCNQIVAIV